MKPLLLLLALALQAPQPAPLDSVRATLRQLGERVKENQFTYGAAAELTTAKHDLRNWVESRLAGQTQEMDTRAFSASLHTAILGAGLLCDECDWNFLGYIDDVRVSRVADLLVVVTATGISCGYDESAYFYAWDGQQWGRVWEDEQTTYTIPGYHPQTIHEVQISSADPAGRRLLTTLGSQTICGGAYKDVYARTWRVGPDFRFRRVLNWSARANDEFPPLQGRVLPGDVLLQYTAGGSLSGDVHQAVRRFTIDDQETKQVDPIAALPRDFVLEWLAAPWEIASARAESPALQAQHAQLRRTDDVGDFAEPTKRCTAGMDLWQVGTRIYEGPKRYYRVRWQAPFTFTLISISETPYPDCTVLDDRGETYANVLRSNLR